jgi:xylan 1,4-beta-xylosidase
MKRSIVRCPTGATTRREALKKLGSLGLISFAPALLSGCGSDDISRVVPSGYRSLSVDASSAAGTIRSLQGVNGPPVPAFLGSANIPPNAGPSFLAANPVLNPLGLDLTAAYQKMGVDFVRTHDLDADGTSDIDGVGINRIFPDWSADPLNPASYNFGPTDRIISGIIQANERVSFNFGRSDLSMVGLHNSATPPDDFAKYAAIAKQVVLHYNEGWANGFNYGIQYWEIWNESDLIPFWNGTVGQYYSLYEAVATAIKSVNPNLKIGGPAIGSNNPALGLEGTFLQFVKDNNLPLDFYTFHYYANGSDPLDFSTLTNQYRTLLDQYGFTGTELHLNEWGNALYLNPQPSPETLAAFVTTAMTYMQDVPLDRACLYYRAGGSLIQDDGSLTQAGYAFSAMGSVSGMSRLTTTGQDQNGFSVLAGSSNNKSEIRVVIGNYQISAADMIPLPGGDLVAVPGISTFEYLPRRQITYANNQGYQLVLRNLPSGKPFTVNRYRIDAGHQLTLVDTSQGSGPELVITAALAPPSVELIVING